MLSTEFSFFTKKTSRFWCFFVKFSFNQSWSSKGPKSVKLCSIGHWDWRYSWLMNRCFLSNIKQIFVFLKKTRFFTNFPHVLNEFFPKIFTKWLLMTYLMVFITFPHKVWCNVNWNYLLALKSLEMCFKLNWFIDPL